MKLVLEQEEKAMYKCWMKGHKENYIAYGVYSEGKMTIKAGSKIASQVSKTARLIDAAKRARAQLDLYDDNFVLLKDITFESVSTAAQFVRGNIINGNRCWKMEGSKICLGDALKGENS